MGKEEKQTILIVDPEEDVVEWMQKHLQADSVEFLTAATADSGLEVYASNEVDLVITDLQIAPFSGLELLKRIRQNAPNAIIILTAAFPPTSAVIEAMRLGAHDVLAKPKLSFELRPIVESALQAADEIRTPSPVADRPGEDLKETIIGNSPPMQEVFKMIGRVSRSDAPVLITGESGSGKEVVAGAIHRFSPRSGSEFMAINCAAIPDALLESELFGHEKGAFTGASQKRVGRFEQCDGGTLFLDEIGDMPAQTQTKILRVLQDGSYSRVGGNDTLYTDARILAATNKNLEKAVTKGRFREDLFYRLNVVRIQLPSLRERKEDVAALAEFFLRKIADAKRTQPLRLTPESITFLEGYDWPGNVRELENTMQRACALANTDVLLPRDIPLGTTTSEDKTDEASELIDTLLKNARADDVPPLEWIESALIRVALERSENDPKSAAELVSITPTALTKKALALGLEVAD